MRAAVITVAGISSRFNENVSENEKQLKAVYHVKDKSETLLQHLLIQCSYADEIIVVGGYKFDDLKIYIEKVVPRELSDKTELIYNRHYKDYSSGYSLYLGLNKVFENANVEEVLFVEGDLDIDQKSFEKVVRSSKSVLTFNYKPIYTSKAVVFYSDENGHFQYAFSPMHGMIRINGLFSSIFNSGQMWKFMETEMLKEANNIFGRSKKSGTNLEIRQEYINLISPDQIELIGLEEWTNCNTREEYDEILKRWEKE